MSDWKGNSKSIHSPLGASNHSLGERPEHDYYATDPLAIDALLNKEEFSHNIWENACGELHLSDRLIHFGHNVVSSDIVKRCPGVKQLDFLKSTLKFKGDIITNPPYKFAHEWVLKSLESVYPGSKVALFLKLTFLEGQRRRKLFSKFPPQKVFVFSKRISCAKNGDFDSVKSSAACYAWFIWQKGKNTNPIIDWIYWRV